MVVVSMSMSMRKMQTNTTKIDRVNDKNKNSAAIAAQRQQQNNDSSFKISYLFPTVIPLGGTRTTVTLDTLFVTAMLPSVAELERPSCV